MSCPLIIAGGPVRDRDWICHEWLMGLLLQEYPADRLRVAVLVNDSQDGTLEVCRWFQQRFPGRLWIRERNHGCPVDNNDRAHVHRDYAHFATVRNDWIDLCLDLADGEEAYFWSVDSDIVCPPDLAQNLLSWGQPLVAALIENNYGAPPYHCNALRWWEPETGPDGYFYWPPEIIQASGLQEIDLTGACMMMHREAFDRGIRYSYHENGEDAPFCWDLRQAGYTLYVDCTHRADHRMKPPLYSYLHWPRHAGLMAQYWIWRERHEIQGPGQARLCRDGVDPGAASHPAFLPGAPGSRGERPALCHLGPAVPGV